MTREICIIYGSQTGNSEQAAKDLSDRLHEKGLASTHMQADDFLELEKCKWTQCMVIITSSYGVGQAPLGCYRFRELCDAWHQQYTDDPNKPKLLEGLTYFLCGLGDSKYTTFFRNPTRIDEAMKMAGAKRVGPLGKADASGEQLKAIDSWMDEVLPLIEKVAAEPALPQEQLQAMQDEAVALCRQINPDFLPDGDRHHEKFPWSPMVAVLAIVLYLLLQHFELV